MRVPRPERGAALLTVLLLVAVMATVSATALDRLTLATRLTGNAAVVGQARWWLAMAEQLAAVRLEDMLATNPERVSTAGNWLDTPRTVALPDGGQVTARISDAGNCFNLNSLVSRNPEDGELYPRPAALTQFRTLLTTVGVDAASASRIASSATDWIDTDEVPLPDGAEDSVYAGSGRLPPNRTLVHESEINAVAGMTPQIATLIRPWICALPDHGVTALNVNSLRPDHAPLIAMLAPEQISVEQARAAIAQRPSGGFANADAFWKSPAFRGTLLPQGTREQVTVSSNWFRLHTSAANAGVSVAQTALLAVQEGKVRVLRREWDKAE